MAAPPGIYVSRPSVWGSPYPLGEVCTRCGELHEEAGSTIPCFQGYLLEKLAVEPTFIDTLGAPGEKTLLCTGCEPGAETCHARVYEQFIQHRADFNGCLRGGLDCNHDEPDASVVEEIGEGDEE